MNEFENIGRKLPYDLPTQSLDTLEERIRTRTTARQQPVTNRPVFRLCLTATAAAVVMFAAGLFVVELREKPEPEPDIDRMLQTASTETIRQAAAENYDDILYNQQL